MITFAITFKHSGYAFGKLQELMVKYSAEGNYHKGFRMEFDTEVEATEVYHEVRSCPNILSMMLVKEELLIKE